ncbi:MAG: hypothetical protein K0R57_6115 [Paenibacillaceae bacterium]|nr:hypothetical protein [Paenibacillaceae bacterium]
MEKIPVNRSRIVAENKFDAEQITVKSAKAAKWAPSLNKIPKQNNPQ